jgi:glycosyltransferase involved in cell wall biosynthesis
MKARKCENLGNLTAATQGKVENRGPNLLIVGAPRAGTTFLFSCLGGHPRIFAPPVKEPHFHLADRWPLGGPENEAFRLPIGEFLAGRRKTVWGGLVHSADDYDAIFAPGMAELWRLEATPNYFAEGRFMAERLAHRLGPNIRIIVTLRDPVARALSHFRSFVQNNWEDKTFTEALESGPERCQKGWAPTWDYLNYSRVRQPLAEWRSVFGARLKVVVYEDLIYNPRAVLADLQSWLGLDVADLPLDRPHNAARAQPAPSLVDAETAVAASRRIDLADERAALDDLRDARFKLPLITIGMPVRNGESTIGKALSSLLNQTYPNIEIVVCDNASTDGTRAIVAGVAERDPRVKLKQYDTLVGIKDSYDRALKTARGEYFLFAPCDDSWAPEFLDQAVRHMQANEAVAVCCGQIKLFDDNGRSWISNGTRPIKGAAASRWTQALLYTGDASRLYGLIRRSVLDRIIPDTDPEGWDHYTAAKLALRGEIAFLDIPAMYRRQTPITHYRELIHRQEHTVFGRALFMRHVVKLFEQDAEFDVAPLKARTALSSFLLQHNIGSPNGICYAPLRWLLRRTARALRLTSRILP